MKMRFHSGRFELKDVSAESGTFEGYASVFGNVDSYKDVIERGAFKKTLSEMGRRIKVLWNHDPMQPIGRPVEMEEDMKGLRVKAKVSETSTGKDVLVLLRDQVIDELSIGYSPIKDTFDRETGLTHLHEVKLYEFSPVTWAANDLATITGVKSIEDALVAIDRYRALASKIAAHGPLSDETRAQARDTRGALAASLKQLEALLKEKPAQATPPTTEPPPPATDPEAIQSALTRNLNRMRESIARGATP